MNRSIAGALVVVAAFVAGCSSAGADATSPVAASPVATTTVDLPKSYRFEPAAIQVAAGATVTWTNHDEFTHNVTFEGDAPLAMKPGEQVTRMFPSAGTFAYLCSLHPKEMRGTVVVGGA